MAHGRVIEEPTELPMHHPPIPPVYPRPLHLGFGGLPRVPFIHLFQHFAGGHWNPPLDPGNYREHESDTFEDLSGGYWARRRKKQERAERNKRKKSKSVNLVDDSEESTDAHTKQSTGNTKQCRSKYSTTTTTTSTTKDSEKLDKTKNNNDTEANDPQQTELGQLLRQVKCTICLSPLEDLTASVCGHVFCEGCIMQAIKAQGKCPICRRPLTERSIHPLFI